MTFKSDIQIAREASKRPIQEIGQKLGISSDVEMALVAVRHGMVDADEANPA